VRVQLPPRFCGLRVSTAGGTIELVGQLNEASLEARSAGGKIALQRARTTDAALHSGGGAVSGGELSASRAVVRSGGGAVALKRLFGLDIEVSSVAEGGGSDPGGARRRRRSESVYASVGASSSDASTSSGSSSSGSSSSGSIGNDSGAICTSSGGDSATVSGGDIELGAAYGERASFHTGGGGFKVAHMSCSGLVAVDTSGGGIHIEGLEGNASLLSGGGLVQVTGWHGVDVHGLVLSHIKNTRSWVAWVVWCGLLQLEGFGGASERRLGPQNWWPWRTPCRSTFTSGLAAASLTLRAATSRCAQAHRP
jgi:hypothetical protein